MNLAIDISFNMADYRAKVLASARPGSIKDYTRLAIMVACSYSSIRDRHQDAGETNILRQVYMQRVKEIARLYPCKTLRPRGYENIENPAHVELTLAEAQTLPALIRRIIVEQFPEIPLSHAFDSGSTMSDELDRIIMSAIESYVPAYRGGNPACTAENYNAADA